MTTHGEKGAWNPGPPGLTPLSAELSAHFSQTSLPPLGQRSIALCITDHTAVGLIGHTVWPISRKHYLDTHDHFGA